jgi:hypothetical protein
MKILITNACNLSNSISPEAERFEKVLSAGYIGKHDTILKKYILWNENSCEGCKVKSINYLIKFRPNNVKIIAPVSDKKLYSYIDTQFLIIDTLNAFGKYYYGVGNIGIICVQQGKVISIKNYNVNEMKEFENDLQ